MTWWLAYIVFLPWTLLDKARARRRRKAREAFERAKADAMGAYAHKDVPPAEERPYIPTRVKLSLVTKDRPLPNEHWRGKSIDRILWELSEGVHG